MPLMQSHGTSVNIFSSVACQVSSSVFVSADVKNVILREEVMSRMKNELYGEESWQEDEIPSM